MRMLQIRQRFEGSSLSHTAPPLFLPFDERQQDGGSKEGWFQNEGVEKQSRKELLRQERLRRGDC